MNQMMGVYGLDPDETETEVWVGPYRARCGRLRHLYDRPTGEIPDEYGKGLLRTHRDAWRGRVKPVVVLLDEPGGTSVYRWPGDFRVTTTRVDGAPMQHERLGVLTVGIPAACGPMGAVLSPAREGLAVQGDPYRLKRVGELLVQRSRRQALAILSGSAGVSP